MPPTRTAKRNGKRIARPQTQTGGDLVKSQAVLAETADATTEKSYREDDISPELAELMDSAP
jgi:hypothetical protein